MDIASFLAGFAAAIIGTPILVGTLWALRVARHADDIAQDFSELDRLVEDRIRRETER